MRQMRYKVGDTVKYQPGGKGTRKKKAVITEVKDDLYVILVGGKYAFVQEASVTKG